MKTTFYVCSASAIAAAAFYTWRHSDLRRALSECAQEHSKPSDIAVDVVRDTFGQTAFVPPKPVEGHTHATAASLRSSATAYAAKVAASCGGRIYSLSMSKSDQRKSIAGERQWYWAKDSNADNRLDIQQPMDILYMCDVDYYVDMPALLAANKKPILLYTVVPEDASATKDDTSFYFEEDGSLTTLVSGGGTYNHFLWDYGTDSLIATKEIFGIPYQAVTYSVERLQIGYSRQLVLIAPIRIFTGIGAILAPWLMPGKRCSRFNPVIHTGDGSFARFKVHRSDGTYYTTARTGSHLCATVKAEIDDAVATSMRLGTTNLMLPTTVSWLGKENRASAAALTDYHRCAGPKKVPTVYPVSQAVRAYTYQVSQYDPGFKPKLSAFMSPLVHGAFCPTNDKASEEACVEGRINKLKKPEPKPNGFVDQCMIEFADLVVGTSTLDPFSIDQVIEKQSRPAQRRSISNAVVAGPHQKRVLKCFVKAEAYADVKDPRNISTYNDRDKLDMATFALALSAHCKQFAWYGPGKTPVEIAARVSEICQTSAFVNQSDYHRMDGTVSLLLRQVDRMVFMKAFPDHGPALNELLKTNYDNIGILPHGTSFEQGTSHGSGCSATSLSQTLRAAFTAYLAFRHSRTAGGQYYSPRAAFDAIGIHLGDDGLDGDLTVESHQWAATRVGLVLEAGLVRDGEPGVTFLARYYSPQVWYGRLDSMCDVKRQLSKFHTTVRLPSNVTPEAKLVEKARGYYATDSNTPVIGELCSRVVERFGSERSDALGIASWWSKFDHSVQFPNSNDGGWMDAEFDRLFPEFDRKIFNDWLCECRDVSDFLAAPLCCEIKPATPTDLPVVVDGDVLPARASSCPPKPSRRETAEKSKSDKGGWLTQKKRGNRRGRTA